MARIYKLLIATRNPGKFEELKRLVEEIINYDLLRYADKDSGQARMTKKTQIISLKDIGITKDYEETGGTFEENATNKALFYANLSKLSTIADDGGIEIDALGGLPGVHSKRWVGKDNPTDDEIIQFTLRKLKDVPKEKRTACMHVVVAVAQPDGMVAYAHGKVRGIVAEIPLTKDFENGFPYRQLFFIPKIGKYYNTKQMTTAENKKYNHRRKAIVRLKKKMLLE